MKNIIISLSISIIIFFFGAGFLPSTQKEKKPSIYTAVYHTEPKEKIGAVLADYTPPSKEVEAIAEEEKHYSSTIAPEPSQKEIVSSVRTRHFSKGSGATLIDTVKANPDGFKLWSTFNTLFGTEVADTSAIALMYENSTMLTTTVGVCSRKYQINGDYRNCVYADINTDGGMDVGLKQINTYWQRHRIAKLGGPNCEPSNSRDITDTCTASQVQWLKNVDNNVAIAVDIYSEQGFTPWVGYKKAFN